MQFLRRLNQFRFKPRRRTASRRVASCAEESSNLPTYNYNASPINRTTVCARTYTCVCVGFPLLNSRYNNQRIHLLILTREFPREPLRGAADPLQGGGGIEHPAFQRAVEYLDRRLAGLRAAKSITQAHIRQSISPGSLSARASRNSSSRSRFPPAWREISPRYLSVACSPSSSLFSSSHEELKERAIASRRKEREPRSE